MRHQKMITLVLVRALLCAVYIRTPWKIRVIKTSLQTIQLLNVLIFNYTFTKWIRITNYTYR